MQSTSPPAGEIPDRSSREESRSPNFSRSQISQDERDENGDQDVTGDQTVGSPVLSLGLMKPVPRRYVPIPCCTLRVRSHSVLHDEGRFPFHVAR